MDHDADDMESVTSGAAGVKIARRAVREVVSYIENESASDGDLDEDYGESEGSSAAEQARRYGKVVKAVLALSVALAVGNADVRGRVRMHAAPDLGAGAGEPGSRLGSLQAKAWARRAVCWSMQLGRGPVAQILRRRREGTSTRPAPTATRSTRRSSTAHFTMRVLR